MNLLSNKKLFIYIFTVFTIFTVNNAIGSDERTERKQGNLSGVTAGGNIAQNFNEHRGGEGGSATVVIHSTAPMTSPHLEREKRPDEYFVQGETYLTRQPPSWEESLEAFQYAANVNPPHILACIRCAEYFHNKIPPEVKKASFYYERALSTGENAQIAYGGLMKLHYEVGSKSARKKTKEESLKKAKAYGEKIEIPSSDEDTMLDDIDTLLSQLDIGSVGGGEISSSAYPSDIAPVIAKAVELFEESELSNAKEAGLNLSPSLDTKSKNRVSDAKAKADRIIAEAEEEAEANRILAEAVAKAEQIKAESDTKRLAAESRVADAKIISPISAVEVEVKRIEDSRAAESKQATELQSVPQTMTRSYPEIARGYEAIYNRFINGRLVYKGPAGERSFSIADIVNSSLEGEFNLNGLTYTSGSTTYNISDYLRIKLGNRKVKENEYKTTVWLVPQFAARAGGSSFSTASWTSDVGVFWTWGQYGLADFDYLTTMQFDEISSKNLYDLATGGQVGPVCWGGGRELCEGTVGRDFTRVLWGGGGGAAPLGSPRFFLYF